MTTPRVFHRSAFRDGSFIRRWVFDVRKFGMSVADVFEDGAIKLDPQMKLWRADDPAPVEVLILAQDGAAQAMAVNQDHDGIVTLAPFVSPVRTRGPGRPPKTVE